MIATRAGLIQMLPAYKDAWVVIHADQTVRDIIREVLDAHEEFGNSYDIIAPVFDYRTTDEICNALYSFCKHEIEYREETDDLQTTATPAGILQRGFGDCKHYAGFTAGVLDALNRRGKNIDWCYRFASYRALDSTPHHVFVVVNPGTGREKWIDATPEANGRQPIWIVDKKVKSMALVRNIAGIDDAVEMSADGVPVPDINQVTQEQLEAALNEVDTSLDMDDDTLSAIQTLAVYQLINDDGTVVQDRFDAVLQSVSPEEREVLANSYNRYILYLQTQQSAIGNIFKDAWRGVKVATLALPRNAFLGLVALNVFGMASKMARIIAIPDAKKKLVDKWYSLGGKEAGIIGAINSGAKKKAILGSCIEPSHGAIGVAPAAAAPAWLAIAGGIIAAVMPLVTSLLKQHNQYTPEFAAIDAGNYGGYGAGGGGFFDTVKNFIVQNPIPSAAAAALLLYVLWKD